MKPKYRSTALLAFLLAASDGCSQPFIYHNTDQVAELEGKRPKMGMNREQLFAMYGRPDVKERTKHGEIWGYHFSDPPDYMGVRPNLEEFIFDENGKLKDSMWTEGYYDPSPAR